MYLIQDCIIVMCLDGRRSCRVCKDHFSFVWSCLAMVTNVVFFFCRGDCNSENSTNQTFVTCELSDLQRIGIYFGLIIGVVVFNLGRTVFFFILTLQAVRRLHDHMFETVLRAPILFFDTNPVGKFPNGSSYGYFRCMYLWCGIEFEGLLAYKLWWSWELNLVSGVLQCRLYNAIEFMNIYCKCREFLKIMPHKYIVLYVYIAGYTFCIILSLCI